jgi:hypothetical protein
MALASFQAVKNSLCPFFDRPYPVVDGKAPALEILEDTRHRRHGHAGIVQGLLLSRKDVQRFSVEDDMAVGQDQEAAGQAGNIVHVVRYQDDGNALFLVPALDFRKDFPPADGIQAG